MFIAGKQIKRNKIKRALQIIYFFFFFIFKKSHSMTVYVSKIKKKNVFKNINYICIIRVF
jgi:hypothetical protein